MVEDLLTIVKRRTTSTKGPQLLSAASNFLKFVASTPALTPVHALETELERFVIHLKERHYKKETVKAYRYCLIVLVRIARENGWDSPPEIMPPAWAAVFALARDKWVKAVVRFAVINKKTPSTLSEDDLITWSQECFRAGKSLDACRTTLGRFRKIMSVAELAHLKPLVGVGPKRYGVSLKQMHPALSAEIRRLLKFRTAGFEFDRDGPPISESTANRLRASLVSIVGFVENIRGGPRVENLSSLILKDTLVEYVRWALDERRIQGNQLESTLSTLRASFKSCPAYRDVDMSWVSGLIKKLPMETRLQIDKRKERKGISYAAADTIASQIGAARNKAKDQSAFAVAGGLRDELLMKWLVILPWRQRNLRECRLSGGAHRNLYLEPIPPRLSATRPKWLALQEESQPDKPVWQIYFSKDETKSKNEFTAFLPSHLIPLLEEYLEHRDALIPADQPDPGTLFLNHKGRAMRSDDIRNRIRTLSARHAGVAVNPHLFRDIVAYEWLRQHPADYLTISKLLWHKNVEYTLRVYGSKFNESTGIARMDDWRCES